MQEMKKLDKDSAKIEAMFSSIAFRYDLLNKLLSLGRDRYWRRYAVSNLPEVHNGIFLDVATGTGDIAIEIIKRDISGVKVIGVDVSDKMIEIGRDKVRKEGYSGRIELRRGNINALDFMDSTFDGAIVAFGIRNIQNYKHGIKEMTRVVKEGGKIIILEFASQQNLFLRGLYRVYITRILPAIGELISGKRGAYRYLPDSVAGFPPPEELARIMREAGLSEVAYHTLTFGITTLHTGIKEKGKPAGRKP